MADHKQRQVRGADQKRLSLFPSGGYTDTYLLNYNGIHIYGQRSSDGDYLYGVNLRSSCSIFTRKNFSKMVKRTLEDFF